MLLSEKQYLKHFVNYKDHTDISHHYFFFGKSILVLTLKNNLVGKFKESFILCAKYPMTPTQ